MGNEPHEVETGVPSAVVKPADKPSKKSKGPGNRAFKKSKKFGVKKLILLLLIVAVILGGGYGVYRLFFYKEAEQIITGTTKKDSITTVITGTATVQPTKFQNLTIPVNGTVNQVYVKQGDKVAVGDKLYTIDTTSLNQSIASVQSSIATYQTQMTTYSKNVSNLTISAPFSGKLLNTTTANVGDSVSNGAAVATLVDDSTMKLSLYFSYAYKDAIYQGMSAEISVPQYMSTLTGTVSGIDYVSYVTAEGTTCFKVTISVTNPGSLIKGLSATATLSAGGLVMSPADSGTLDYNQTKTITTQVTGTVSRLNVMDSQKVSSGETLLVLSNDDYSNQLSALQKQIESAQLNLTTLQTELSECSPTATVAGTVIYVKITSGDTVTSGATAMAIYNTDEVKIVADISESQNDYITEGMTVTITKGTSSSSSSSGSASAAKPAAAAASASASASAKPSASAAATASASASPSAAQPSGKAAPSGMAAPSGAMPSGAAAASASDSSTKTSSSSTMTGTVTKKSLQATASNGVAYFETTITIQSNGTLSPGIYVTYTITAAQASDVVLAPVAAVQQTTAGTCLFVKADTKPDNAVTLADGVVPDGYYAVVVETGLTSNEYVEIKSGVSEGMTVYERTVTKNTATNSDQTSQTSNNATQQSQGQFQGAPPGGMGGGPGGN